MFVNNEMNKFKISEHKSVPGVYCGPALLWWNGIVLQILTLMSRIKLIKCFNNNQIFQWIRKTQHIVNDVKTINTLK